MIRIDRGEAPDGFDTRAAGWWAGYQQALAAEAGLTPGKYWTRVRAQLRADAGVLAERFHGKCAFCEVKPEVCSNPQVEHYRPKSRPEFTDRMFTWENWLLSCGRCNQNKWKHFPDCDGTPCLLDPTVDDPSEHLEFYKSGILPKTTRGKRTIEMIRLDRSPLADARAEWLMQIQHALLLAQQPEMFEIARVYLIWAAQEDSPLAAVTRQYLREKTRTLGRPENPQPRIEREEAMAARDTILAQPLPAIQELL